MKRLNAQRRTCLVPIGIRNRGDNALDEATSTESPTSMNKTSSSGTLLQKSEYFCVLSDLHLILRILA